MMFKDFVTGTGGFLEGTIQKMVGFLILNFQMIKPLKKLNLKSLDYFQHYIYSIFVI